MVKIYDDWDKEGAEKSYRRALELNPNLAQAYNQYAWYLLLVGKQEEAVTALKRAVEIDPLGGEYPAWLAMLYIWLERYDEAIHEAQNSLDLFPNFPVALNALGSAYAAKGMYQEAIAVHEKMGAISLDWKSTLGLTYVLAGQKDKAVAVATELESQPKVWYSWGLAEIYATLGEKDTAFYWLEEAFKQRHPYIQWIKINIYLKSLRNDPRFIDLLRRMNVPE
jgi:tetratricopeptide (TPR) repeat protein